MSFKNYLNEIGDAPFEYSDAYRGQFIFYDDDQEKYIADLKKDQKMVNGKRVKGITVTFAKGTNTRIDKSSNPLRVFSTIYKIIKNEMPSGSTFIEFSSELDEPSRVKLYTRMVKVLQRKLKWKTTTQDDVVEERFFVIWKEKS